MHLANALGAAWARDEMMENPRTFKSPAAEQALREFLEQAFAEAAAAGVTAAPRTNWLSESFGKFLREQKGYTDEQIAAECAANGLPAPGVKTSGEPQGENDAPEAA